MTASRLVPVTSAGSPAQRAGLEPGDMIVAANVALTSLDQLTTIVRQGGSTLKLTVLTSRPAKPRR
ncbi:MAG: PDZ domain-containing protein [Gammaproteobacteria bacterium]